VNSDITIHLQNEDNVALFFNGFPSNCTEAEASDLLWFQVPGGLNIEPEFLSVRGQSCIAVLSRAAPPDE